MSIFSPSGAAGAPRAGLAERLVNRLAGRRDRVDPAPAVGSPVAVLDRGGAEPDAELTEISEGDARGSGRSRRGFFGGAALVGAAMAVNPWGYLVRPASAYDAVCGLDAECADGYSVFCCTINGGSNSCPPNSFIGGWWKADSSSFCGGAARYYIDCNAFRGQNAWQCRCNDQGCDRRRVACNQFRYGQCRLDIPASQTGPVVCRMVSCTPPWQQYAGVCTSTSATDNRTATHSAPCNGREPIGSFDTAVDSGGAGGRLGIRITGWALDQDLPEQEIQVAVYLDGAGVAWFPTGVARPDVNAAFGVPGNHGFDIVVPAAAGGHTVTVFAINVGGGAANPVIGSRRVTVTDPNAGLPRGVLDSVSTGPGNTMVLQGWAFDPDAPGEAIQVAVYRNGQGEGWWPTGVPRPDVNAVFGIPGQHGFRITIPVASGDHAVDVFAINVGGGSVNPVIGSGRVRDAGFPLGRLDGLSATAGEVRLSGWAFDPDDPGAAIHVAVYRDGIGIAWFPTGLARPDVNGVFGIPGDHGFDIRVPTSPGRHEFTVFAINVGAPGPNPVVGSGSVQVPG
ncbi:hypothetical protein [Nakamurella leprariae]|uniref:Twin-arginine translocation signal domain-containing protein n=1 Tax=Nakamurella leprariae TaxID=2803911 RepID=A0A938YA53_9ACTN|nr:hypothetical protein [Nakamurella leprariae]MBM9468705.1 hypothetical protein [Nakamurella leprariae]